MLKPRLIPFLRHLLRWSIILAIVAFLAIALLGHWQEVQQLRLRPAALQWLVISLLINLFAHLGLGVVWGWILKSLHYSVSWHWAMITFAVVEIAKYLPGDVWQIYGRIRFAKTAGIPVSIGAASIILESAYLTVPAAAFGLLLTSQPMFQICSGLGLLLMLVSIHPKVLNWILRQASRIWHRFGWGKKPTPSSQNPESIGLSQDKPLTELKTYPSQILVGLTGLIFLRSLSFLVTIFVLISVSWQSCFPAIAAFSVAWVVGIVIPGIPGGVGLFEFITLALLHGVLPDSVILGSVVLYRLINTLTEAIAASLGWLLRGQRSPLT